MEQFLNFQLDSLTYWMLIFLRISGLFFLSPVFGRRNIPPMLKAGFCLILASLLTTSFPPSAKIVPAGLVDFAGMCIKELLIGLLIGYVTSIFFYLVYLSGQLIDIQIGIGMSQIYDPGSNISAPISGGLLYTSLLVYFFSIDGHHMLIKALGATFNTIPIGQVNFSTQIFTMLLEAFIFSFSLSLTLAIPIIAAAMLTEVALGMIIRTVPQMNIFSIGIPLKILVGLIMLFLMIPIFSDFLNIMFDRMFVFVEQVLGGLM